MPQVNLSSLAGPELRQLLDASRRRGDAALSYKVLQEMAARRDAPEARGPFMTRRPAEPRLIEVELDEAKEADDLPPMPNWRAPSHRAEVEPPPLPESEAAPRRSRRKAEPAPAVASAAPDPVAAAPLAAPPPEMVEVEPPPPPVETDRPPSLRDADPEPFPDEAEDAMDPDLRLHAVAPESPGAPRRAGLGVFAGFALGIAAGIALGWWAGGIARDGLPPIVGPIRTAALSPRPMPSPSSSPVAPSAAEPVPEAAPASAVPPPPPAQEAAPDLESPGAEPPPSATESRNVEVVGTAETAQAASDRVAPAVAHGCAKAPTPADRAICGDPHLRRLQGDLRRAYTQALAAHADRALLRQRQLAWRDARNKVTDLDRLARLYEERIRKLDAATAQALRHRSQTDPPT